MTDQPSGNRALPLASAEKRKLLARLLRERAANAQPALADQAFADDLRALAPSPIPAVAVGPRTPRTLLLTGASGFLGTYLLRELLDQSDAHLYCLVRAASPAAGRNRLAAALERYNLSPAGLVERVTVLPGDIAAPRLGLGAQQYELLASTLDAVVHCAATVHYAYSYQALRAVNVVGTQHILELARAGSGAALHFVSSFGVFEGALLAGAFVDETTALAASPAPSLGYTQSKLVAELLARSSGLPTVIYRPAFIAGDSRTGLVNQADFLWLLIRACIRLGVAPAFDVEVDLCPVDVVARGLVRLAMGGAQPGTAFHLFNPHPPLSWAELWDEVAQAGTRVRLLPLSAWLAALGRAAEAGDDTILLLAAMVRLMRPLFERLSAGGLGRIDSAQSSAALLAAGVGCPAPAEVLARCLAADGLEVGRTALRA